ncbi:hypothetical protein WJX81_006961 [Elliptochloris bilobata]|uniref:Uncharacterized protein n=1 Tax=Elliptochloris bilobata TaxID=381761 RepID=A0AAW1RG57_9CHLO
MLQATSLGGASLGCACVFAEVALLAAALATLVGGARWALRRGLAAAAARLPSRRPAPERAIIPLPRSESPTGRVPARHVTLTFGGHASGLRVMQTEHARLSLRAVQLRISMPSASAALSAPSATATPAPSAAATPTPTACACPASACDASSQKPQEEAEPRHSDFGRWMAAAAELHEAEKLLGKATKRITELKRFLEELEVEALREELSRTTHAEATHVGGGVTAGFGDVWAAAGGINPLYADQPGAPYPSNAVHQAADPGVAWGAELLQRLQHRRDAAATSFRACITGAMQRRSAAALALVLVLTLAALGAKVAEASRRVLPAGDLPVRRVRIAQSESPASVLPERRVTIAEPKPCATATHTTYVGMAFQKEEPFTRRNLLLELMDAEQALAELADLRSAAAKGAQWAVEAVEEADSLRAQLAAERREHPDLRERAPQTARGLQADLEACQLELVAARTALQARDQELEALNACAYANMAETAEQAAAYVMYG